MNGELSQETVLANISEGIEEKKALLEPNIQRRDQAGADKEETAIKISYDRQAAIEYAQTWALDRNEEWADYSMNGEIARTLYPSVCLPEESRWILRENLSGNGTEIRQTICQTCRGVPLPGPVSTNF